jgi:hypothetical protein
MNYKKVLLVVALAVSPVFLAGAQSDWYSAKEASIDVMGFGASRDKSGHSNNAWGMGLGGNYFFTRNLGLGLDTYADAFELPYLLNVGGIFRYPLGDSGLSPYAFGGFGREWTHAAQWMEYLGAGVEYRFRHDCGVFMDVRGVFADRTQDYAVVRFGFRFKFR